MDFWQNLVQNFKRNKNMSNTMLIMMTFAFLLLAVVLIIYGVSMDSPAKLVEGEANGNVPVQTPMNNDGDEHSDGGKSVEPQDGGEYAPADPVGDYVREVISGMSVEEKVGQLLLVRSNGVTNAEFAALASRVHAGGVVLFADDVDNKDAAQLTKDISVLQESCGGKLLVCVDEEGGTVVRVSRNPLLRESKFRSPQAVYADGGMEAVRSDAQEKCRFLSGFGFNVNFAPVADVVTDSNGFLYQRAFGKDANQTANYVNNVVDVMTENNMGCTIKHFPGYSNAVGDTHNGLVVVGTSREDIINTELTPFRAGIAAGADSVMVTHSIMTELDPDRPSSLSPTVISILRDELEFDGVIISDGMDMGAILQYGGGKDVCVAAFLAGNDLLCTPADPDAAYNALLAAVDDGTISAERLNESVGRIIRWKINLGLYD